MPKLIGHYLLFLVLFTIYHLLFSAFTLSLVGKNCPACGEKFPSGKLVLLPYKKNRIYLLHFQLAWIIHESRLLQMQGTGYEAVVLHRECPVTKQVL